MSLSKFFFVFTLHLAIIALPYCSIKNVYFLSFFGCLNIESRVNLEYFWLIHKENQFLYSSQNFYRTFSEETGLTKPYAFIFRQYLFDILPQDSFTAYTWRNTWGSVILNGEFSQKFLWKVKPNALMNRKLIIYKNITLFAIFLALYVNPENEK